MAPPEGDMGPPPDGDMAMGPDGEMGPPPEGRGVHHRTEVIHYSEG